MKLNVNAKGLLALGALLSLAACSPNKFSGSSAGLNQSALQGTAIIGGAPVAANDPIINSTVQIFALQVSQNQQGKTIVSGLAGCTGTLLTQDVVLSAAHCTMTDDTASTSNPGLLYIYLSSQAPADIVALFKAEMASPGSNPLLRQVSAGMTGANWANLSDDQATNWGDLSLLKFPGGLPAGYVPAQLIPANVQLTAGMPIVLAGFGLTQPMVNNNQVQATSLNKVQVSILDPNFSQTEMMIQTNQGKGSCHGDSGGPAYITVNGQNYVAGVTSRADSSTDPQGECIGNTIYTETQPYLNWIAQGVATLESPNYQPQPIAEPGASSTPQKSHRHRKQQAPNSVVVAQ